MTHQHRYADPPRPGLSRIVGNRRIDRCLGCNKQRSVQVVPCPACAPVMDPTLAVQPAPPEPCGKCFKRRVSVPRVAVCCCQRLPVPAQCQNCQHSLGDSVPHLCEVVSDEMLEEEATILFMESPAKAELSEEARRAGESIAYG